MNDLCDLTLADARAKLVAREISAAELARAHIDAIEKSSRLNAYVLPTPERALEMAAGAKPIAWAKLISFPGNAESPCDRSAPAASAD